MKIDDIQSRRLTGKSASKKTTANSSNDFMRILGNHLSPTEEVTPPGETVETSPQSPIPTKLRLTGVSLSENAINMLESYSKALGDLHLNSEDLAPLIDALEGDTTALLDIKEQIPANDPLAQLIDRVATISYLETEKYRRGDYNNQ